MRAWGNVFIRLFGCLKIKATFSVVILRHQSKADISGGKIIDAFVPAIPAEWCEYYGVKVDNETAILFKAVDDNYNSPHGFCYLPGTTPAAPDWNGSKQECGGGLYFSPHPKMASEFNSSATKFVACPVALKDIAVHPNGQYPEKIKARCICKPIYEVDEGGEILITDDN